MLPDHSPDSVEATLRRVLADTAIALTRTAGPKRPVSAVSAYTPTSISGPLPVAKYHTWSGGKSSQIGGASICVRAKVALPIAPSRSKCCHRRAVGNSSVTGAQASLT